MKQSRIGTRITLFDDLFDNIHIIIHQARVLSSILFLSRERQELVFFCIRLQVYARIILGEIQSKDDCRDPQQGSS
jgi:hypothetical protein